MKACQVSASAVSGRRIPLDGSVILARQAKSLLVRLGKKPWKAKSAASVSFRPDWKSRSIKDAQALRLDGYWGNMVFSTVRGLLTWLNGERNRASRCAL